MMFRFKTLAFAHNKEVFRKIISINKRFIHLRSGVSSADAIFLVAAHSNAFAINAIEKLRNRFRRFTKLRAP